MAQQHCAALTGASKLSQKMRDAASIATDQVQALKDIKRAVDEHIAEGKSGVHDPKD